MSRKIVSKYRSFLFITILSYTFFSIGFLGQANVSAATSTTCVPKQSVLGLPTWYKYLEGEQIDGRCSPVVNQAEGFLPIGIAILEALLTLGGVVAIGMVIVGAFKFILSQGEPDKAKSAIWTVINSLIGLAIIILSSAVVSYIGRRLGG